MNTTLSRIKKRYHLTIFNIKNDCYFSKKLAMFRFISDIGGRIGFKKISGWAHSNKENYILNYISEVIDNVIIKYKDCKDLGIKQDNAPIWVCWWDGVDQAPILVQKCINSIKTNANNHPVYVITKDNYMEYLEVSDFIFDKVVNGNMKLAHFADYLRVCLLEKYGGLWLDATIYCSEKLPEDYFSIPFFTCKSEIKKGFYISDYQWTTFCLGGWKHNIFYKFMKDSFETYWKRCDYAIDYLFFDDLIYLAKNNIPSINELMEKVQINNIHRDDLQAAMNKSEDSCNWNSIINEDTCLYKLSWRESYIEKKSNGEETIYGRFIK